MTAASRAFSIPELLQHIIIDAADTAHSLPSDPDAEHGCTADLRVPRPCRLHYATALLRLRRVDQTFRATIDHSILIQRLFGQQTHPISTPIPQRHPVYDFLAATRVPRRLPLLPVHDRQYIIAIQAMTGSTGDCHLIISAVPLRAADRPSYAHQSTASWRKILAQQPAAPRASDSPPHTTTTQPSLSFWYRLPSDIYSRRTRIPGQTRPLPASLVGRPLPLHEFFPAQRLTLGAVFDALTRLLPIIVEAQEAAEQATFISRNDHPSPFGSKSTAFGRLRRTFDLLRTVAADPITWREKP